MGTMIAERYFPELVYHLPARTVAADTRTVDGTQRLGCAGNLESAGRALGRSRRLDRRHRRQRRPKVLEGRSRIIGLADYAAETTFTVTVPNQLCLASRKRARCKRN